MSLQLFSDHSDFLKSRRALMISSVSLILLHDVEMISNNLRLFDLEFVVSLDKIRFYLMLATGYFFYVFIARTLEVQLHTNSMNLSQQVSSLRMNLEKIKNGRHTLNDNLDLGLERLMIEKQLQHDRNSFFRDLYKIGLFFAIDLLPVSALSLFAIFYTLEKIPPNFSTILS